MANKTVSKAEHTVLNTSLSFSSLYDLLWFPLSAFFLFSSSHQYSFHLPLTHFLFVCFFTLFLISHSPCFLFLWQKGWERKTVCNNKRVWVGGNRDTLALYILAHWWAYWIIWISVKCLSLYSAVANASARSNVPIMLYILGSAV